MLLLANKIINVLFTVLKTDITREGELRRYIINEKNALNYTPHPRDIAHNSSLRDQLNLG